MSVFRGLRALAKHLITCLIVGVHIGCGGAGAWVLQTQYSGSSLEVVLGSDVTFKWQYSTTGSSAPRSITWGLQASTLQGFIAVQQSGNLVTNTAPPKYKDRVSWTGNFSKKEISYRLSNVTKEDNVLYGLFVQFDLVTTVTDTVKLKVLVPAKFTNSPPLTRTINERDVLSIECAADGTPTPNVTWVQILNSGSIIKSEGVGSSTLTVLNIQRPNGPSGKYTYECQAKNIPNIAAITSKTEVTVHYEARITRAVFSPNSSWIGQSVLLTCETDGVPDPTITLSKPDGTKISEKKENVSRENVFLNNKEDFGDYKCTADNGFTPHTVLIKLTQIKEPGPPTISSTDEDIQATSLTVRWNPPNDNGGSPVTGYRAIVRDQGSKVVKNVSIGNVQQQDFGDLKISTNYTLEVSAINVAGEGRPGTKSITTKFEGAPEAAELSITNTSNPQEFKLRWTKPKDNRSPITGYTIYTKLIFGNGNEEAWVEKQAVSENVRSYMITLEAGKTFKIVVTASNKFGEAKKEENRVKTIIVPEPPTTPSTGSSTSDGAPESTVHAKTVAAGRSDKRSTDPVVIGGAVGAVILAIIAVATGVLLWRRKRQGSKGPGSVSSRGALSADDEGYASVNRRAAVQNLGAGGDGAYADVGGDSSVYTQVDKSKKKPKKPKRKPGEPGELVYADLADFSRPRGGAVPVRPEEIQRSDYADISQFSAPKQEPTYDNLPRADATYANVQAC